MRLLGALPAGRPGACRCSRALDWRNELTSGDIVHAPFVEIFRTGLTDPTTVTDTVQRRFERPPGTFAAWTQANGARCS